MKPWLVLVFIAACDKADETDTAAGDTDVPVDTDPTDTDTDTDVPVDTDVAVVTVTIDSPADASTWAVGDVVELRASAMWDDGTPASAVFAWTSSIDGALGGGATLPWTATLGTHTIDVRGTAEGDQDDASVTLIVEEPVADALTRYGNAEGIPSSGVTWYDLDVMDDGRVIGAASPGLLVFDGAAAWKTVGDGLATNATRAVLQDSFGEVWVAYTGATALQAQRMTIDPSGSLTINSAVNITATMEVNSFGRIAEQPYGAGVGDVWLGSNEGLCVYDRDLDKYLEHMHPTHPHGTSRGLAFTPDGDQWGGDEYQVSHWGYDNDGSVSSSGDLEAYEVLFPAASGEPIRVREIAADGTTLYLASEHFGYGVLDTTAASMVEGFTMPAPEGAIPAAYAVQVDRDGLVWIGAPDGLWTHDPVTGDLTHVGVAEITEAVEAIAIDEADGSMWLATPTALWHAIGVPE